MRTNTKTHTNTNTRTKTHPEENGQNIRQYRIEVAVSVLQDRRKNLLRDCSTKQAGSGRANCTALS